MSAAARRPARHLSRCSLLPVPLRAIHTMPTEVLRLHLDTNRLSSTGRPQELRARLCAHLLSRGGADHASDSGSQTPREQPSNANQSSTGGTDDASLEDDMSAVPPRSPLWLRRHHAHLPSTSSHHRSRQGTHSHDRQPPSTRSTYQTQYRRCCDSSFSWSPSPPLPHRSSSSSAERHRHPGHRHHHCHHRHHHHDRSRSSSDEWGPPTAISCAPPLHRHLESEIQRGKYIKLSSSPQTPLP